MQDHADEAELQRWTEAGRQLRNPHVLHRTTAQSKTCTIVIQWRCIHGQLISRHQPLDITFTDGADLIAQLQKRSPSTIWNTIFINAPHMVIAKEASWNRLAPIALEDIATRNNYMKTQQPVQIGQINLRTLPERIDEFCTTFAQSRLRIRALLQGQTTIPSVEAVEKELSQIRITLHVVEHAMP